MRSKRLLLIWTPDNNCVYPSLHNTSGCTVVTAVLMALLKFKAVARVYQHQYSYLGHHTFVWE